MESLVDVQVDVGDIALHVEFYTSYYIYTMNMIVYNYPYKILMNK